MLNTLLDYGQSNLESPPRPMVDVALDRRPMEGFTVPLPVESSGLAMAPSSEPMGTFICISTVRAFGLGY